MIIDFNSIDEQTIPHFKGGEKETRAKMFADGDNRILFGRLAAGASIGLHAHEGSSEIIYILSGSGKEIYDGTEEPLFPGACHYCPNGHSHSTVNTGSEELVFFAVVPSK